MSEESTTEESGPPVTTEPVRPTIILTPPPLTLEQAEKIAATNPSVQVALDAIVAAVEDLKAHLSNAPTG